MDIGWRRLGQRIAAERGARSWSIPDLAEISGISERTIGYLEAGSRNRYKPSTLGAIEGAFGWEGRSVERILAGGEPRRIGEPWMDRLIGAWYRLNTDQQQMLVIVAETIVRQH